MDDSVSQHLIEKAKKIDLNNWNLTFQHVHKYLKMYFDDSDVKRKFFDSLDKWEKNDKEMDEIDLKRQEYLKNPPDQGLEAQANFEEEIVIRARETCLKTLELIKEYDKNPNVNKSEMETSKKLTVERLSIFASKFKEKSISAVESIKEKTIILGEKVKEKKEKIVQNREKKRDLMSDSKENIRASNERLKDLKAVLRQKVGVAKEKKRAEKRSELIAKKELKARAEREYRKMAERKARKKEAHEARERARIKKRESAHLDARFNALRKADLEHASFKKRELNKLHKENLSNLKISVSREKIFGYIHDINTFKIILANHGTKPIKNVTLEIQDPIDAELITRFFFVESLMPAQKQEFLIKVKPLKATVISLFTVVSLNLKFSKTLQLTIIAKKPKKDRILCTECGIQNTLTSLRCKHCKASIKKEEIHDEKKLSSLMQEDQILCPYCGGINEEYAKFCYNCGSDIP